MNLPSNEWCRHTREPAEERRAILWTRKACEVRTDTWQWVQVCDIRKDGRIRADTQCEEIEKKIAKYRKNSENLCIKKDKTSERFVVQSMKWNWIEHKDKVYGLRKRTKRMISGQRDRSWTNGKHWMKKSRWNWKTIAVSYVDSIWWTRKSDRKSDKIEKEMEKRTTKSNLAWQAEPKRTNRRMKKIRLGIS